MHGASEVVVTLLTQYGVQPHIFDIQGNTPLHYASVSYHPNALALVKVLVTQYGADVIVKNAVGQTAYDVSVKDPIRHFLLPLQLQKETQQCLDNGGVGLPQGIAMWGLARTAGMGLPPPPMMGGSPPPQVAVGQHQNAAAAPMSPYVVNNGTQQPQPQYEHQQPPKANPAPHIYARSGQSAAALNTKNKNKYRADGFNSSDNDSSLQAKYGHDKGQQIANKNLGVSPNRTVPSPPNGNATAAVTANPYADGYHAAVRGMNRYPTYDAVSDTVGQHGGYAAASNHTGGYGMNAPVAAAATPQYSMFIPAGAVPVTGHYQQQQQQQPTNNVYPNQTTTQQSNYQEPFQQQQHQQQQEQQHQPQPQPNNQYSQSPSNDVTYQGQQYHQDQYHQQNNLSLVQPVVVAEQQNHQYSSYPTATSNATTVYQGQQQDQQQQQQQQPAQQQINSYSIPASTQEPI